MKAAPACLSGAAAKIGVTLAVAKVEAVVAAAEEEAAIVAVTVVAAAQEEEEEEEEEAREEEVEADEKAPIGVTVKP